MCYSFAAQKTISRLQELLFIMRYYTYALNIRHEKTLTIY